MSRRRPPNRCFEVRPSPIHGKGGFAVRPLARGTRVAEYTGERVSHREADSRYDDARQRRHHTYLFSVDRHTVIDAAVDGGPARYLNHSCEPNCAAVIEGGRVFIETLRDVAAGEELTYNYAIRREGTEDEASAERYACRCGSERCRGTMLSPRRPRSR